jgi:hypothetical protein
MFGSVVKNIRQLTRFAETMGGTRLNIRGGHGISSRKLRLAVLARSRDGFLPPLLQKEKIMLASCAHPSCARPFRYLHEGKLFRLEPVRPKVGASGPGSEWFWLCDHCASKGTLQMKSGEVVTILLGDKPRLPRWAKEGLCLRQAS